METRYPIESKVLDGIFTFHPPQGDQAERYEALRAKGREVAALISELCPSSRERSMAISHIQEAVMCANAAIACNENGVSLEAVAAKT